MQQLDYPSNRFEVVVVDDGGSSPLDEIVRTYGEGLAVRLIRQSNSGPGAARNTGAAQAKGEYLAFTDDDCRPAPDWLSSLETGFKDYPVALLGGRTVNYLDNSFSAASQLIMEIVYGYYNPHLNNARFFASNNIALSATAYREVGGFDATFVSPASEDRELCDRWSHLGRRLVYVADAVVRHGHALNLRSFWHQHFNYGRGAFNYHQRRSERGSGRLQDDLGFYRQMPRLALEPLSRLSGLRAIKVLNLLAVWQVANIGGYLYERLNNQGRE
jgi:cellulose synthase/poly-beta-1,6-N-acetylglucosamine synthase-like glycosyltransferase